MTLDDLERLFHDKMRFRVLEIDMLSIGTDVLTAGYNAKLFIY